MLKLRIAVLGFAFGAAAFSIYDWAAATPDQPHGFEQWGVAIGWPLIATIAFLVFVFFNSLVRWVGTLDDKLVTPSSGHLRFTLEAGDTIVGSPTTGELYIRKVSGKTIDLNAMMVDVSDPTMSMKLTDHPLQFMLLTETLGAVFGLSGSTVGFEGGNSHMEFTCTFEAPHSAAKLRVA